MPSRTPPPQPFLKEAPGQAGEHCKSARMLGTAWVARHRDTCQGPRAQPPTPCPVARVGQPKSLKPAWALLPSSLDKQWTKGPPSGTAAYRLEGTPRPPPRGHLSPSDKEGNTGSGGAKQEQSLGPWVCRVSRPLDAKAGGGGVPSVNSRTWGKLGKGGGKCSGWWVRPLRPSPRGTPIYQRMVSPAALSTRIPHPPVTSWPHTESH